MIAMIFLFDINFATRSLVFPWIVLKCWQRNWNNKVLWKKWKWFWGRKIQMVLYWKMWFRRNWLIFFLVKRRLFKVWVFEITFAANSYKVTINHFRFFLPYSLKAWLEYILSNSNFQKKICQRHLVCKVL